MTRRKVVGGIVGGLVGAVAGALIGAECSRYFPNDFTFAGERGYEAVGFIGIFAGAFGGGLLGVFLARRSLKKT